MSARFLNVLLVGGAQEDVFLLARELERSGFAPDVRRVRGIRQAVDALATSTPDIVLAAQPRASGILENALRRVGADAPVLLLVGAAQEQAALAALARGARDYVIRGHLARLGPVVSRELRSVDERRECCRNPESIAAIETRHGATLAIFDEAYYRVGIDGVIQEISPVIKKRTGYEPSELIGRNAREIYIAPEERERYLEQMLQHGAVEDFELTLRKKSGDPITVSVNARLIRDESGRPLVIEGALRDITERKRIEAALRRNEQLYRTLARNIPNGSVFMFDEDLRYTLVDGTGLRDSGPPKEVFEGRTMREVFDAELCRILEPAYQGALKGQASVIEASYAERIYEVRVLPVRDECGRVRAGMAMTQDITERKRVEKDREELIRRLQEALSSIKTLRGLIPICSSCRRIRNDQGYWQQVDEYIREHSDVRFSHGLCKECAQKLYPDLYEEQEGKKME
jgi:PAS domain S-box-containing protein